MRGPGEEARLEAVLRYHEQSKHHLRRCDHKHVMERQSASNALLVCWLYTVHITSTVPSSLLSNEGPVVRAKVHVVKMPCCSKFRH